VRGLALAVLGASLLSPMAAQATEPLRLLLVRQTETSSAVCSRGTLFVVQSFSQADTARGVAIADTLELASFASGDLQGSVRTDGSLGWRIEIADVDGSRPLLAASTGDFAPGSVLVGRRPAGEAAAACRSDERLVDGGILMRRLRQVYSSPSNDRPIEIRIQP
jgi:hypothetical protein